MNKTSLTRLLLLLLAVLLSVACAADQQLDSGEVGQVSQATTTAPSNPCEVRYQPVGATASSVQHAEKAADKAIDGNLTTRWSSAFSNPQWLRLDLGNISPISKVVLKWESAASADYDVQVSSDGTNWTTVGTDESAIVVGTGNSRVDTHSGLTATGRYVRMYSRARTTSYGNSLWEFDVYANPCATSCTGTLLPIFGATASSAEHSGKAAAYAVDGNSGTRWSSLFTNPQWLSLDLGSVQTVSRVVLDWESASSANYQLQVSNTGANNTWTTVATRTSSSTVNHRFDDIAGLNARGRYLRIYSTARTTAYGNSLWEVQVYGNTCGECSQPLALTAASATSMENSTHTAAKAIDGNMTTRWSSQFSDNQSLFVDLGSNRFIGGLDLVWQNSSAKDYTVSVGPGASGPWQVVYTAQDQPSGARTDKIADLIASGRWVRVHTSKRNTQYGVSLFEVRVFGSQNVSACQVAVKFRDACPLDPGKLQPGICGCGKPDTDRDSDGRLDCQDCAPDDATNAYCIIADEIPELPDMPEPIPSSVDPTSCTVLPELSPSLTQPDCATLTALGSFQPTSPVYACETVQLPEDCPLDPTTIADAYCESDAECPAGSVCRIGLPTSCGGARLRTPEFCQAGRLHCGRVDAACLTEPGIQPSPACTSSAQCGCTPPNAPANPPCEQIDVCPDPGWEGDSGPDMTAGDPYAVVQADTPASLEAANQGAPEPEYLDPPNDPDCQRLEYGGCWCKLAVDDPPMVDDVQNKPAEHGANSLVRLDFDPNVNFDVNLDPLPLGETQFGVNAGASLSTKVIANLFGQSAELPLLEAGAGVTASRCGFSTLDSNVSVLGFDFVDAMGSTPFDSQSHPTLAQWQYECENAVKEFEDAANRAKKAMRDAQTLLNLYYENNLDDGQQTFSKERFCPLVASADPGFPVGNCMSDPVEKTINRFIAYYGDRADILEGAQLALYKASADFLRELEIVAAALNTDGLSNVITFLNLGNTESSVLLRSQFFIGPIPVNITVESELTYGVRGDLYYRFSPLAALSLTPEGPPAQLIAVGGKIIPSAGAGVLAFAGVGVDVPGFAVKAGIAARLNLVTASANLDAGAGLSVQAHEDIRTLPLDLAPLSIGPRFPAKTHEYYIDWAYNAGVDIGGILAGSIEARLKLKAFFFSKTFKKTLISFDGFNLPHIDLISGGNRLGGINLPNPAGLAANSLGQIEMQLPFVNLRTLPEPAVGNPDVPNIDFELPPGVVLLFDGVCNEPCGPGQIRVGNNCVNCGEEEIVVGNTCVPCGLGRTPDASRTACENCDVDAEIDVNSCAGETLVTTPPVVGDNCPEDFYVHVSLNPATRTSQPPSIFIDVEEEPAGFDCRTTLAWADYLEPDTRLVLGERAGAYYSYGATCEPDEPFVPPSCPKEKQDTNRCCAYPGANGCLNLSAALSCPQDSCEFASSKPIPASVPNDFLMYVYTRQPDVTPRVRVAGSSCFQTDRPR